MSYRISSSSCRLFLALVTCCLCGGPPLLAQDISGGAGPGLGAAAGGLIKMAGNKRRERAPQPKPQVRTNPGRTPQKAQPQPAPVNNEQLEEALALGDNASQANRPQDAERAYNLAAKIGPKDARPYIGLGNVNYNQRRFAEAEKNYRRATEINPQDNEAFARLAFTFTALNQPDNALLWARRAVTAEPDDSYGYIALGYASQFRGNYQDAEKAYRRAISLTTRPSAELYVELARSLSDQRRYRDALPQLTKAIELNPNNYTAHFFYGVVLHKTGQLNPAVEQYQQAIKLNEKEPAAYSNAGLIYYVQGNGARAREQWETATRLGSTYPPDRVGLLILGGKLEEARQQLEQYTQSSAEDEDGWLMLADVRRALNDEAGARAADIRAAQITPEYVGLKRPSLRQMIQEAKNSPASNSSAATSSPQAGDLLKVNEKGQTTLMAAAALGRADLVSQLVAAGVKVNARDLNGYTALFYATAQGNTETIEALLKAGAEIDSKSKDGATALMAAAFRGDASIVKLLISRGANVNAASNNGTTPLAIAKEKGHTEIVEIFKKAGAK